MKNVFIATPMYGGQCFGAYSKSVWQTMKYLMDAGYGIEYRDMYNSSLITHARNVLTHLFLKSKCDYMLFVDGDQTFRPKDIEKMIKEDKDIIIGAYPKKFINWEAISEVIKAGCPPEQASRFSMFPNFSILPDTKVPEDLTKSFKIAGGGTGLMLIKREVFEKMLKTDLKKFKVLGIEAQGLEQNERITEFWKTDIVDEDYIMEDYNFCLMWRNLGGEIYLAPYAKSTHYGTYEFNGTMAQD